MRGCQGKVSALALVFDFLAGLRMSSVVVGLFDMKVFDE